MLQEDLILTKDAIVKVYLEMSSFPVYKVNVSHQL